MSRNKDGGSATIKDGGRSAACSGSSVGMSLIDSMLDAADKAKKEAHNKGNSSSPANVTGHKASKIKNGHEKQGKERGDLSGSSVSKASGSGTGNVQHGGDNGASQSSAFSAKDHAHSSKGQKCDKTLSAVSDNVMLTQIRQDILALTGAVTNMGSDVSDLKTKYNDMKEFMDYDCGDEMECGENPAEPGEISDDHDDTDGEPPPKLRRMDDGQKRCDLLEKLSKEVASAESCSAPVTPALAKAVDDIITAGVSDEKLEARHDKYNRPENCEKMIVTKINQAVWDSLSQNSKTRDLKLQNVQKGLVTGLQPLVCLADNLFKVANGDADMPSANTVLEQVLDAVTILTATHHDLNMKRRELIKPDLKDEYKPMCAARNPVSQELFGEDLPKMIKDLKDTSAATLKIHKYKDLGYYSYNYRGRGRGGRGFGGRGYGGRGFGGRGHFLQQGYQRKRPPPNFFSQKKRGRGRGQATPDK